MAGALMRQGKYREAEAACRRAIELKPGLADAHGNLGNTLALQGNYAQAEAAYRKAIELGADLPETYCNLSGALMGQQKYREAEAACRKAIELKPDFADGYYNLGNALKSCQRFIEAETAYRKAIELRPDRADGYNELGIALLEQQKYAEAEAAYRKALSLLPNYAPAHHNLGFVLMQQFQFDRAAQALNKAAQLFPADHPYRETARRLEQRCRRFAVLDTRLAGILRGTEKPASAAEQIELAQLCLLKKLYAAAARFFNDAFTAEPKLADDVRGGARYNAACAAAQAGCARGRDAKTPDETERARWRRQAREWLRQDLTWWDKALDNGNPQTKADVRLQMQHWQTDSDLAGLRDPSALAAMSPDERSECLALWQEVAALLSRIQTTR